MMKKKKLEMKLVIGEIALNVIEKNAKKNANSFCRGMLYESNVPECLKKEK